MYTDGSAPPSAVPRRRRRLRKRHGFLALLLVILLAGAVTVGTVPWALHIGDRTTLGMTWNGVGRVHASDGGSYELYVHFDAAPDAQHGCSFSGGCDNVHGSAQLCGTDGVAESFTLSGHVHTWWSTDGARTDLTLAGGTPKQLPDGVYIAFSGSWHGPQLMVADSDNSFTEAISPGGDVRSTTSSADAGTAQVTISYGSSADFQAACNALAAK